MGVYYPDKASVLSVPAPIGASMGLVDGVVAVNKFGRNTDVDVATVPEDVWSGGNNANANALYPFMTSSGDLYISSSDNGDVQDMEIQGLDENNDIQTVTQVLSGQTKTLITSPLEWLRVFRVRNKGDTLNGTVYVYEDVAVVAGVPQTPSAVKAIVQPADNQTMMAVYSVPRNKIALITYWIVSVSLGSGTQDRSLTATLRVSESGQSKTNLPIRDSIQLSSEGGVGRHRFEPYNKVNGPADILIRADEVSGDNSIVTGAFDIWLVDA